MTDTTARGAGLAARAHHAGDDGPAPTPRRWMSAKRKQSAVLRLLRGEDLELVSRELGVTAAELRLARRLPGSGRGRAQDPAGRRSRRRDRSSEAKVGKLTIANEFLDAKIDRLETHPCQPLI